MVTVFVPWCDELSALPIFVSKWLFWSAQVYKQDLELFVDSFYTDILKRNF